MLSVTISLRTVQSWASIIISMLAIIRNCRVLSSVLNRLLDQAPLHT